MAREPIPTWTFVLVVVRSNDRFLILREAKHGRRWYLPAGRVELNETFVEAAIRETMEETGVPVRIDGVLSVQHTPSIDGARLRILFTASPVDDTPPRTTPNEHSHEARWATLEEVEALPLRGTEVIDIFRWVADGAAVYPVALISSE